MPTLLPPIELADGTRVVPNRELVRVSVSLGYGSNPQFALTGDFESVVSTKDGRVLVNTADGNAALSHAEIVANPHWLAVFSEITEILHRKRIRQDAIPVASTEETLGVVPP